MNLGLKCEWPQEERRYTLEKRPKLFLSKPSDVNSTKSLLQSLGSTVTNCSFLVLRGLYHRENMFAHFLRPESKEIRNIIFSDPMVQRHNHVSAWEMFQRRSLLKLTRFNWYQSNTISTSWDMMKMDVQDVPDMLPEFPMQVNYL